VLPFLGQGRIVDDQPGIVATNQSVRLGKQRCLERSLVPNAAADKAMKPVVADIVVPCSHGLNTLAITWPDQPCNVGRAHRTPRLVS
jgi:hypothetical protein